MRIKITLVPEQYPAAFPTNHHNLAALIYRSIAIVEPHFAQFIHDEGLRPGSSLETDRRFKFFVFAIPELPPFRFQRDYKYFEHGKVQWQISSPLTGFIEALIEGLKAQESVKIGQANFFVEHIEPLPSPSFTAEMRFIALSPLTVATSWHDETGKRVKHYLRAGEEDFGKLVAANLLSKYRAFTGKDIDDNRFQFQFDQGYIDRAGGYESRKITRLVHYGSIEIKAVLSPFIVSGNPELINLGWECGFGSSNSQGFGMAGI